MSERDEERSARSRAKRGDKKVGLLIGREWSWPSAFITEVNKRELGVTAEFVKLGGTFVDRKPEYDVIIDRMSHEIPYYRAFLKFAALSGTYVINNPFTWAADDKFFGEALARHLGLKTPRTVVLPNKRVETQVVPESFRNLEYPMNWQGIIDYVGVPAILKDAHTGGRRISHRVFDVDDLIQKYDESDTLTMILQQIVNSDEHVHCFVIGQEYCRALRYSVTERAYLPDRGSLSQEQVEQMQEEALRLSRAYGYDMNMVEYVVNDDDAYVINATNPAPDMDINLLKPAHFSWCVSKMADFAIRMAQNPQRQYAGWQTAEGNA
ncbi:MAG: hypothetical protein ACOC9C_00220 [Chloroflexota bacterium]